MRRALVLALAGVLAGIAAAPAWAPSFSRPDKTWVANGQVNAIVRSGDTIYIGGSFSQVGPRTGGGAAIDAGSAQADLSLPEVAYGGINAVAPDGAGGWYVGGSFLVAGGITRNRIAHIRADKTLDPAFNPNAIGS